MYFVLAFYKFTSISDPKAEIAAHRAFFKQRDVTSRIYISENGINGQMSAIQADAEAYMQWMHSRALFTDVYFKIHTWHEQVFPRNTVKYRKKLVAIDESFNLENQGEHVSPARWKEMLNAEEKPLLLDVRNDYEWQIGHFEGAELPPCETFRDFAGYADDLKTKSDPKTTPVMMYCTGGIRCELYSSILKEKGFEKVFQLDGGIINYGLKEGCEKWKGKLFVFDDRLAVPLCEQEAPVIGKCHHCGTENDTYFNCANMDCNCLFLSCRTCIEQFTGCCQESCKTAPRVRPYHKLNPHKPFRRRHLYPAGNTCALELTPKSAFECLQEPQSDRA